MSIQTLKPLNAGLFRSLQARFGTVKVANEGQHIQFVPVRTLGKGAMGTQEKIVAQGEQYRVCCPYCSDRRHRLYVSYLWNTKDNDGKKLGKFKLYCQNEQCDMTNFEEELKPYMRDPSAVGPTNMGFLDTQTLAPTQLPGTCVSLRDLEPKHPANTYVKSRNFDPLELAEKWGVCYCLSAAENEKGLVPGTTAYASLVRDRLIIPIFWEKKLVGWQARTIDPNYKGHIKYYTMPGMAKGHLLYNGDVAQKYKFGVIVEGPLDVWRVGERAAGLLGKTFSFPQLQLIYAFWSKGGCCQMLDADAQERDKRYPDRLSAVERNLELINSAAFAGGFFNVSPPENEDPGSMRHEDIWSLISSYARTRGIEINLG